MKKLLIIDGNSLAYRAFFALPLLSNSRGEYTNAVYGFCNILFKAISTEKPTHVAVTFDAAKHNFRHDIYAEYKGTRKKMPEELAMQMPILRSVLQSMNLAVFSQEGIEADDIIGTIAKQTGVNTVIITGDKDALQLIDNSTSVLLTKKGISETALMTEEILKQETGLTPSQIIDLKALMGDSSDNIPGVAGVGEKTAHSLLSEYGTLDGVYKNLDSIKGKLNEKLVAGKDMAYLSYQLATINTKADVAFNLDNCQLNLPFPAEAKQMFELYQFKTLLAKPDWFVQSAPEQFDLPKAKHGKKMIEIKQASDLARAVEDSMQSPVFAFCFDKQISFATEKAVYFATNEISMFSGGYEPNEIVLALKEVFKANKTFISFGNKSHMHYFAKLGLAWPNQVFDLQLAMHLTHAGFTPPMPPLEQFEAQKQSAELQLEQMGMKQLFYDVELPLVGVLYEMEHCGCKVDLSVLETLSGQIEKTLASLQAEIVAHAGVEFNVSSPKQVSEVLFDKLMLPTTFNKKRSTAIDVLTEMQFAHPIIPLIIRHRKFFKLKTSFLDSLTAIALKHNGFIHTSFNQTLTTTGRLSSSEPNLQNIPTRDEEGKAIRGAFVSRFDGGSITTADYNQIELRILAALSQDQHMIDAFANKVDIHRSTASKIFNVPLQEVTASQRRDAKSVNFGVVYGISDYGLSQNIGCSVKDAKRFIDRYFEIYNNVKAFLDNAIALAKQLGYTTTILGRRRAIPELRSANRNLVQFGERVAMNAPIQGSAADVIKLAMIQVSKALKKQNCRSCLVLQIHDELLIDTYPGEEQIVSSLLKKQMEDVVNMAVELSVEVGSGISWLEAK